MAPPSELTRRDFSLRMAAWAAAAAAPGLAGEPAAPGRRPNLVFLFSDQHAFKYAGFMGHPLVRTPHLDRIAARGTVFANAYCGNPVCCPSRSGTISGVYGSDVNSFCNTTPSDGSLPAWSELLKDAGYRTFGAGKVDANRRFDASWVERFQLTNEHETDPDVTAFFRRPLCSRIDERPLVAGRARERPHPDHALAVQAIEFIRRQAGSTVPWAVYCGGHMPHPPFVGRRDLFESYLPHVTAPEASPDELEGLHYVFQQLRHFKNLATPIPEERRRRARAAYFAMITELDEHVGEVWRALEETGQLENTVLVYSSDHGEALGDHGLWFKNQLYEVAARVPLVMAGPGIPAGRRIAAPVGHVDLIRTFLDWGGARQHDRLRGHSLRPLLAERPGEAPPFAYCESNSEGNCTGSFMVREGDWKYIHVLRHPGLLFNLAEDPEERRNRIADPALQAVRRSLEDRLRSVVDPAAVNERAFAAQARRRDAYLRGLAPADAVARLEKRLGAGEAAEILVGLYGPAFAGGLPPAERS